MKKVILIVLITLVSNFVNAQWQAAFPDTSEITSLNTSDSVIFAGTIGGVFISNDYGNNWTYSQMNPNIYTFNSVVTDGSTIFAGINNGLRKSTNNGSSWTYVTALINFPVWSVLVSGSNIFTASYLGVHISSNAGLQWTAINNGLAVEDAKKIIANGTDLFVVSDSIVYLSTNNGGLWNISNTGLMNPVYSIASKGTDIFAGTSDGVYISVNNGGLWTPANSGLPNSPVYSLAVSGTNIFAATDSGVFLSSNNGAQWSAINTGLPTTFAKSISISGTNIFATLNRSGHIEELWKRPLSEVTGIEEGIKPNHFNVFPNPSAGTIRFMNNDFEISKLEVYNSLGERVFNLSNPEQQMINDIDLSVCSDGIYFIRIYDGEKFIMRKFILQ